MGQIGKRISALEEVIGRKAVIALAQHFPGQRIYVPWANGEAMTRFMDNFSPLIGAARVAELMSMFGGLRITIPANTPPHRLGRAPSIDVELVAELTALQQLTAAQIAVILRCDPRAVYAARSKARRLGLLKRKRRKRRK